MAIVAWEEGPSHGIFSVTCCFVAEDLFGYAVVDSGATRSMSSIRQMCWLQCFYEETTGDDPLLTESGRRVNFTYAGGDQGQSCTTVGVPHRLALPADHSAIWFPTVPSEAPTLLGLDFLEPAGWLVDTTEGYLHCREGRRPSEPLDRLPTGHWGLSLIPERSE